MSSTSLTSGSEGGWGKRPAMDLARSLPNFFAQVVRPTTAPHADDRLVAWIGTRAQEIPSVAQLGRQLAAYAAMPRGMQARLAREQRASRPPTALQVRLRQVLDQLEQSRDPMKE